MFIFFVSVFWLVQWGNSISLSLAHKKSTCCRQDLMSSPANTFICDVVKTSHRTSPPPSRRWGWEPTTHSLLWRTATSGSRRRSISQHHAAPRPPRSSSSCRKEPCSTRPSSTSCPLNRRASLNWWTWSKADWTGLDWEVIVSQVLLRGPVSRRIWFGWHSGGL